MSKQLLLDLVISVIIFTQFTGCATSAGQILNDTRPYQLFAPTGEQVVSNARIPSLRPWGLSTGARGSHSPHAPIQLFQEGRLYVDAHITWSNGYLEEWIKDWEPERGKQYALFALELNPAQTSRDVSLQVESLGDELPAFTGERRMWREVGVLYTMIVLLPLYALAAPFMLYRQLTAGSEKPFDDCCFVWIAAIDTGETVAGTSPENAKLVLPKALESPPTEK